MSKVIWTTYYTGKPNPQRTAKKAVPNDFSMIKEWYDSVVRLRLQGVIFHDHLTNEFIKRYSCPNVAFTRVPYYSERGLNDERYYMYQRMLKNPAIEWLLTTDLFDVEFPRNPFEFMTDKTKIYVGSETPDVANFHVIKNNTCRAYGEIPDWWPMVDKYLLNAGIIGGHRDIMIRLFDLMIKDFDKIEPKGMDANMFVLSRCIHGYDMPFVTGFPLHSSYKKYEKDGQYYIRHK